MQQALLQYPKLELTNQETQDLIHGKQINSIKDEGTYALYDFNDYFLGIGVVKNDQLRVKNIFMKSYLQNQDK